MADIKTMNGPDDPHRCQANSAQGQCTNQAVELQEGWGQYCLVHGGNRAIATEEKKNKRLYDLGKWQAQLEKQADHSQVKSLREEIGILRVVLQEQFSIIKDTTDMMLHAHKITDIIMKIEKLVASCHKLEGSMGQLLDKSAILNFASQVVNIIGKELAGDEDKLKIIGDAIISLVGRLGSEEE